MQISKIIFCIILTSNVRKRTEKHLSVISHAQKVRKLFFSFSFLRASANASRTCVREKKRQCVGGQAMAGMQASGPRVAPPPFSLSLSLSLLSFLPSSLKT